MGNSVTTQCRNMLKKRQELWSVVSLIWYTQLFIDKNWLSRREYWWMFASVYREISSGSIILWK
jgi:hypothetical protein